jgi:hypothetical protein
LSNLYLHEVLDDWFVKEVQPHMEPDAAYLGKALPALGFALPQPGPG